MKNENGIPILDMINYLQDIVKHHGEDVVIWHLHDWTEPIVQAEYLGEHVFSRSGETWPKRVELSGS